MSKFQQEFSVNQEKRLIVDPFSFNGRCHEKNLGPLKQRQQW